MAERTQAIPLFLALRGEEAHAAPALEIEIVGLFDQMRGRVLRYILAFGLPAADAEEVVQDVFVALYRHLTMGKSREALSSWIFRVAHNLSLKRRQSLARTTGNTGTQDGGESARVVDPHPGPEAQLYFLQRRQRLLQVVAALPETDRECLHLRSEGLRYREIAEVLGISVGSVANSLARSLSRLAAADERLG